MSLKLSELILVKDHMDIEKVAERLLNKYSGSVFSGYQQILTLDDGRSIWIDILVSDKDVLRFGGAAFSSISVHADYSKYVKNWLRTRLRSSTHAIVYWTEFEDIGEL